VEEADWLDVSGGRWLDVRGYDDGLAASVDDLADFFEAAEEAFAVVGVGGVGQLGVAEFGEEREGGCVEILGDDLRAVGLVEAFKTDQALFWFCHSEQLSLLLLLELEELVLLLEEERHELRVDGVSVDVHTSCIVGCTLARGMALTTVTNSGIAVVIVHHHVANNTRSSSKGVVQVRISNGQTTKSKTTCTILRERGGGEGGIGMATLILIAIAIVDIITVLRSTIKRNWVVVVGSNQELHVGLLFLLSHHSSETALEVFTIIIVVIFIIIIISSIAICSGDIASEIRSWKRRGRWLVERCC